MDKVNPLHKFFRQAAIHMELPSGGRFWPQGSIDIPVTGQIPVMPMTARDEITLRTPDALMNGSGIVEVIQSCCPSIKDAWATPNVDVDALLIGIRIATYGPNMDIDSKCPHCAAENRHGVDLGTVLGSIQCPDYNHLIAVSNLQIKLKPVPFFGINRENTVSFQEQKLLQALEKPDIDPQLRAQEIQNSMTRIVEANIEMTAKATDYIEIDANTRVSEYDFIHEFYTNAAADILRAVQLRLTEINAQGAPKPSSVQCSECTKGYIIPLEFDYANFFVKGF